MHLNSEWRRAELVIRRAWHIRTTQPRRAAHDWHTDTDLLSSVCAAQVVFLYGGKGVGRQGGERQSEYLRQSRMDG